MCDSCYSSSSSSSSPQEDREHSHDLKVTCNEEDCIRASQDQATDSPSQSSDSKVTARYVGEVMQSAVSVVVGAMKYPKDIIVESARPQYWVTDDQVTHCHKCQLELGACWEGARAKHHCRACGQGFCEHCSQQRMPVPSQGWLYPVRVCDDCAKKGTL